MSLTVVTERTGDTLSGNINGVNLVYTTSFDFDAAKVNVYVNGLQRVPDVDNGWVATAPRTITMKRALKDGDTLAVEYQTPQLGGGGALGGIPNPPILEEFVPGFSASEYVPSMSAEDLVPSMGSGENVPSLDALDLRPVLIIADDE
jgi:hypothetical protein